MLAYYLLIGIPLVFSVLSAAVHKRENRLDREGISQNKSPFVILVFFFILILIISLRHISIGADTRQYHRIFARLAYANSYSTSFSKSGEHGFYFLTFVLAHLCENYQLYLTVMALLSLVPVAFFYYKYAELSYLSVIMFTTVAAFSMYFSGLRQIIAMAFAIPAWYCAKNKKLVLFLLLVPLAMLFHTSAFILFAIYPLYHAKITKKWLIFVVPVMILIFVFNRQIFLFLIAYVYHEYNTVVETGAYQVLILLVLFAVLSFVLPDDKKLDQDTIALRNFLLLCVAMQCFAPINQVAMRLNYYYLVFVPVLVSRVIARRKENLKSPAHLAQGVLTMYFTFYFFQRAYTGADPLNIYPYLPFWS